MATFVSDTFTDADATAVTSHTGETGATWTRHTSGVATGLLQIKTNRLACNYDGNGAHFPQIYYASGTPAAAEYDVSADVVVQTNVDSEVELLGRVNTGAQTYYLAEEYGGAGGAANIWQLYKCVAGTFTQLGTFSQSLTPGNTYALKLEIRDATKKVYVDGVSRISSADNAIAAAGKAGVCWDTTISGGTTVGYHLDNFTAADPVTSSIATTSRAALPSRGGVPMAGGRFFAQASWGSAGGAGVGYGNRRRRVIC